MRERAGQRRGQLGAHRQGRLRLGDFLAHQRDLGFLAGEPCREVDQCQTMRVVRGAVGRAEFRILDGTREHGLAIDAEQQRLALDRLGHVVEHAVVDRGQPAIDRQPRGREKNG